jgi:hypothetical protein
MGTLIRHGLPAMPVLPLPVAMIEPSFRAPLVAAVGAAALPEPGFGAARGAAIALSAITMPADPEHCVASSAEANPLTKNHLAMQNHVRPQAGLDNGNGSWQVRTIFAVWLPAEGCQTGRPVASNDRTSQLRSRFDEELYTFGLAADD